MAEDTDCERAEGSGCTFVEHDDAPLCLERRRGDSGDSGETGIGEVIGRPCGEVEPCGCGAAPSTPGLLAIVCVVAALRRVAWQALVALVAATGAARAQGIDAQHLQPLDGGTFPVLREADAGGPWEPYGAWSFSYGHGLVNLYTEEADTVPLPQDVVTTELAGSIRIGRLVRMGIAVPVHPYVRWRGEDVSPGLADLIFDEVPPLMGDVGIWAQVPMLDGSHGAALSWYVHIDAPSGTPEVFLGDPGGGVTAMLALSHTAGDWDVLGNLGAQLARVTFIPGIAWGVRGQYGAGVHRRILGRLSANVEVFGSISIPPDPSPGDAPAELTATVSYDVGRGLVLHAGGGAGLTTGVGSPSGRVLVMADMRRRSYPDRDEDGHIDMRDGCPDDPEDEDGLADADGCPEADFDEDGVPDVGDGCPRQAETVNGHEDADGCPDLVTEVALTITGDLPLEQAQISFAELPPFVAFADEPNSFAVSPGHWELQVEADGFHPFHAWVDVPPVAEFPFTVALRAIQFGDVVLRVTDPADVPIDGYLRRDGPLELLPKAGRTLRLTAGPTRLAVSAPGYLPRTVEVDVPAAGRLDVTVALQPSELRLVGSRIETTQQVRFPLDSADIPPDGEGPLDDLAALLLGDPRIELLRIEGHADERGTSRYNLDLSRRRAEAIRAWLIAAGVAPERLEAIGTGEARPAKDGETASRRVEFTVLVWADASGEAAPTGPAPR